MKARCVDASRAAPAGIRAVKPIDSRLRLNGVALGLVRLPYKFRANRFKSTPGIESILTCFSTVKPSLRTTFAEP